MQDPRIGQEFGDYIIRRKLAEGGMGAVYLAEHPSGMRKVVKFMLGEAIKIPAIRKRFENECLAAKRLKGRSGIVEIDSFGERNGEMYLVMEYLDGVTLEAHIRQNGRLTEHHTFHVMVLILRALAVLHEEGIIHRDLKPANVFLRDTDERPWDPTLIDFGIVHDKQAMKTAEFGTREGQMVGTPGFMATEQYGQANRVTPATDIFACAVIMWLMLTGELPWGFAGTEFAQYDRQLHHVPVWPAHVPLAHAERRKQLLVDALSPDPAQRPQSAQLFALLLAQRLEPVPPHVPDGIGMIEKLARKFLHDLPAELETVRHPNGKIEVASFWSPRTPGNARGSSGSFDFKEIRVSAAMAVPPVSAPTVGARPHGSTPAATPALASGSASPMTTISAASGTASPPRSGSPSRVRLVVLGLGTALAIGGVTFGVSQLGSRSPTSSDSIEPTPIESGSQPSMTSGSGALSLPPPPATAVTGSAAEGSAALATPTDREIALDAGADATIAKPSPATTTNRAASTEAPGSTTRPRTKTHPTTKRVMTSKTKRTDESSEARVRSTSGTSTESTRGSASAPRTGSDTFDPNAIKE